MHPKEHPLLHFKNLLEMLVQSPVWVLLYGTGLVFPLAASTWVVYGMGWHVHPKLYPLPHVAVLDFLAETMIWVRTESNIEGRQKNVIVCLLAATGLVGVPAIFLVYVKYLFWFWVGGDPGWQYILSFVAT